MALSWSARRRLFYASIVLGFIIAVLGALAAFFFLSQEASCSDGIQNQEEVGVDCGGPCRDLCEEQVSPLTTLWSRPIPTQEGRYDAVALIENPNFNAGVSRISYSFKLYDNENVLVAERMGETYVNPSERFAIVEEGISTGERTARRSLFSFTEKAHFVRVDESDKPDIGTRNTQILDREKDQPRVRTTIVNNSLETIKNIELTALLFDEQDNITTASRTFLEILEGDATREVTFLFPAPLGDIPTRVTIIPRVNTISDPE